MGVPGQRRGRGVLRVAPDADPVPGRRGQPFELGAPILAVRIVAGDAGHLPRAAAQQQVAPFAGGDRAAPRAVPAPLPSFPGERVAREQHLVATGAHPVDPLGARRLSVAPRRRRARLQERAPGREVRQHARIVDVFPAAAVAGLAADADLDEVPRPNRARSS